MALRYRPMTRDDVGSCVQIMATHPAFPSQYGKSTQTLGAAWSSLLGSDAFRAIVFEEIEGTSFRVHSDELRPIDLKVMKRQRAKSRVGLKNEVMSRVADWFTRSSR